MNCGVGPAREAPYSGQDFRAQSALGRGAPDVRVRRKTPRSGPQWGRWREGRRRPRFFGGSALTRRARRTEEARGLARSRCLAPCSPRPASPARRRPTASSSEPPVGPAGQRQTPLSSSLRKILHRGPSSLYILKSGKQNPIKSKRMGIDRPPARLRRPLIGGDGSQRRKSSLSRMIG